MPNAIRVLLLASALCVSACATPRFLIEGENARTNTHIVLAFEETVFNKHRVHDGFNRYVADEYREHDPELPDGLEGSAKALDAKLTGPPSDSHLTVKRTVAQRDIVAVHAFWEQHAGQGSGIARVDIYRLENAKIVEHWSVSQPQTEAQTDSRRP
jgi:predicted SnoaL-like aldol condensation-catalyzing enzyme